MAELRVAVVGVGHLGRHHARILATLPGVRLVGVVDARLEQARTVAEPLGVPAYDDHRALFGQIDAVSVAVPTSFHRTVAGDFLERGVHTLVEKPLALNLREAEELVALANARGATLQVGHIERFNPTLRFLPAEGPTPRYLDAERLSTYTFRSTDIGVVLDLMIHDIDLVLSIVKREVVAVSAVGMSVFGGLEDVANARIWFEDGTIADLAASRASLHAQRKIKLWNEEGYTALDLKTRQAMVVRPSQALRQGHLRVEGVNLANSDEVRSHLFGNVLEVARHDIGNAAAEPLALELADFVDAIKSNRPPRVSGDEALRAMRVAELVLQGIAAQPWSSLGAPSRAGAGLSAIPAPHILGFGGSRIPATHNIQALNDR
jgi:predicted dehydrogenase